MRPVLAAILIALPITCLAQPVSVFNIDNMLLGEAYQGAELKGLRFTKRLPGNDMYLVEANFLADDNLRRTQISCLLTVKRLGKEQYQVLSENCNTK